MSSKDAAGHVDEDRRFSKSAGRRLRFGSDARALAIIVIVFFVSRAAAFLAGVRFDASPLDYFIQYPDPKLLQTDLIRTVWYFHMAPPLYNLFLGLMLKLFGSSFGTAVAAVYLTSGLALALCLYTLMRALRASLLVSAVLTIGFVVSPATILYENWLYPDYLIAAFLVAGALLLHGFATTGNWLKGAGFCALLGLTVLSRSYYNLVWLAICLATIMPVVQLRKRFAVVALVPLVLVLALYARNYQMWGFFSGSSASGLNFYNEFIVQLPVSERAQLAAAGRVSKLATQPELYLGHPEAYGLSPPAGISVLDQTHKSSGAVNYGNSTYVAIWNQFERDGIAIAEARPVVLERAVVMASLIFFAPSQEYDLEPQNRTRMKPFERLANVLESGQIRDIYQTARDPALYRPSHWVDRLAEVGWLTLILYALSIPYGVSRAWSAFRAGERPAAATLFFVLATIIYVGLADLAAGVPDNNRYRFMIDPLALVLFALLATRVAERIKPRSSVPVSAGEAVRC